MSYFPCDIPYMSTEELEENGIRIPKNEVMTNDRKTQLSEESTTYDTISRQAAIDAMCELMNSWFGGDPKDEREEIKWMINHLPSAQPKIIRCKDCVHYHTDVFGGELGVTGIWENLIVAHNACDKWAEGMNCVTPDGFCFLAERRVENADVKT